MGREPRERTEHSAIIWLQNTKRKEQRESMKSWHNKLQTGLQISREHILLGQKKTWTTESKSVFGIKLD